MCPFPLTLLHKKQTRPTCKVENSMEGEGSRAEEAKQQDSSGPSLPLLPLCIYSAVAAVERRINNGRSKRSGSARGWDNSCHLQRHLKKKGQSSDGEKELDKGRRCECD
jgi:hypothetical protein